MPVRRHPYRYRGSHRIVHVKAESQEGLVPVVQRLIQTQIELVEVERAGIDNVELGKNRMIIRDGKHPILIIVLVICKPGQAVTLDGAAKTEARLTTSKKGIGTARIA